MNTCVQIFFVITKEVPPNHELPRTRNQLQVVNREPVGEELGIEYGPSASRDLFLPGDCDDIFAQLAVQVCVRARVSTT